MPKPKLYTIGDLKRDIADLDDSLPIILQKDSEGNGYSPLSGIDANAFYRPESTWAGEVYSEHDFEYLQEEGEMDEDDIKNLIKVVVVFPVN